MTAQGQSQSRGQGCVKRKLTHRKDFYAAYSHFVDSMTAQGVSDWSGCRVGLAPTEKRRLFTAHAKSGVMHRSMWVRTPLLNLSLRA